MTTFQSSIFIPLFFLSVSPLGAWEASRPLGGLPVVDHSETNRDNGVKVTQQNTAKLPPSKLAYEVGFRLPSERVTLPYPHDQGVSLGQGWDLVNGQKKLAACVVFKTEFDRYQQATTKLSDVQDEETLDVKLNLGFNTKASATGLLKAGGKAQIDTHYRTTTADTVIVVQASVVNGAVFATPLDAPKAGLIFSRVDTSSSKADASNPSNKPAPSISPSFADLQLTTEALSLRQKDPDRFREICGDGFIASIVSGADLYVLYRFRNLERTKKLTIELNTKAGAGIGGLLGGEVNSDFKSTLEDTEVKKNTDVYVVQTGGQIEKLPFDLPTIKERVAALSKEAQSGPRPIFMVAYPYSQLANWVESSPALAADASIPLVRYQKRLLSAYYEHLNIREQQRGARDGGQVEFLLSGVHGLRTEDVDQVGDEILSEWRAVSQSLIPATSSVCVVSGKPKDLSRREQQCKDALKAAGAGCKLDASGKNIDESSCRPDSKIEIDFDDYKYLVRFPVPLNSLSDGDRSVLLDPKIDRAIREKLYKAVLYRHWVERLNDYRCRLFFECMTKQQRKSKWDMVEKSFQK